MRDTGRMLRWLWLISVYRSEEVESVRNGLERVRSSRIKKSSKCAHPHEIIYELPVHLHDVLRMLLRIDANKLK